MVKANQGDIILADFSPTQGREQTGKRPAVVVSKTKYNNQSGFALVCPITSSVRKMTIRISLDSRTKTQGDVLCEQVRVIDLTAREFTILERIPKDKLEEIYNVINTLISVE